MTDEQISMIEQCARGSLEGTRPFPEIVRAHRSSGVERYHVDYCRHEVSYYLPNGDSHVVRLVHPEQAIGPSFSAAGVEAAVRASQRNEHTYTDFLRKTMAAGCVGYFVHTAGRQVLYFGRNGEVHREPFPSAPAN